MIERIPPHNKEAEQAVIGSLLIDNSTWSIIEDLLSCEDFYVVAHKKIFKAMSDFKDKMFDIITIVSWLRDRDELDAVGGAVYVVDLADNVPSAANIEYYAKIVKEKSLRRSLIKKAYELSNIAYAEDEDISEVVNKAQREILRLDSGRTKGNIKTSKEITKRTLQDIERRYQDGKSVIGLSTGLKELDDWTSGLQNGELTIIAGRPGMGKTAIAMNIGQAASLKGECVLVHSIEMPDESLMIRMLAALSKVESKNLRKGFVRDAEWPSVVKAAGRMSDAALLIDDSSTITTAELRSSARRAKKEHNISLLVLDYIQLMTPATKGERREQEVAEISRTLKSIARELHIPVIGISQLNRGVDARTDKRPMMSDLRESGAIEQDADLILFIYRDEVYNKSEDNPQKGIAEIIIGKNRHGPTGIIKTVFLDKFQTFVDLEKQQDTWYGRD